jgi:hypothetical protein
LNEEQMKAKLSHYITEELSEESLDKSAVEKTALDNATFIHGRIDKSKSGKISLD